MLTPSDLVCSLFDPLKYNCTELPSVNKKPTAMAAAFLIQTTDPVKYKPPEPTSRTNVSEPL